MLGLLVLLSGAAGKLLANFTAYKAYDIKTARSSFANLRLLSDPYFNNDKVQWSCGESSLYTLPFSTSQ
jgi:hypothetical protein